MSDKHQHGEREHVPATRRRKAIPLRMARGPQDYVPGQQEEPAVLTSLADMLHWAQNWARSRSIWPFMYALACCGFEMIVAGTVSVKMAPRLRHLWEQMPEPKWVISMGQCANSGGEFYDSYYTVQGVDSVVPVDVYVPGCPPRPEALIEGIFKLREKIEKQGYIPRNDQNLTLVAPKAGYAQGSSDVEEQTAQAGHTQEMLLNLGPQHPSTHGVLRLVLTLEGETVLDCTPVIGYLHRGIEKTLENRPYSHLIGIGAYVNDLGTTTPLLWSMRDREGVMDLFEALGGSRFNVNYVRVGGVLHDFPVGWLRSCEAYLDQLEKNMGELERLVNGSEIFQARTRGVGYLDPQQALAYGISGPMARASGISWDLRVNRPYMAYREVPVNVQTRQEGDCYARNAVRFQEIQESIRLCRVAIDHLPPGPISTRTPVALRPPRGETYFAIESSKGELGVYLNSDGSEYPWRVKLRGPSFVNLQVLPELLHGYKMSDVIAVLGSLDFVVGEVDR